VRYKNRFRQLVHFVFPEYQTVLFKGDAFFSETSLHFISSYPHADLISSKRIDALANTLGFVHKRHPGHYRCKAVKIKQMAQNTLFCVDFSSSITYQMQKHARLINDLQNEITLLKD